MDCSNVQFLIHSSTVGAGYYGDPLAHLDPPVDVVQLQQLLKITAFWAQTRTLEDLALALSNSDPVVTANIGKRLVGFARASSDCVYRATIWDVVVHPEMQGGGIGRKLVETILTHPRVNRVERVYLMTTHKQHFYERIGFEVNTTTTMVLHNHPIEVACTFLDSERSDRMDSEFADYPRMDGEMAKASQSFV
jgi:N-acetylglutamate synthase-like GNAT family acetyltransferase